MAANCEHRLKFSQFDSAVVMPTWAPGALDSQFITVSTRAWNSAQASWSTGHPHSGRSAAAGTTRPRRDRCAPARLPPRRTTSCPGRRGRLGTITTALRPATIATSSSCQAEAGALMRTAATFARVNQSPTLSRGATAVRSQCPGTDIAATELSSDVGAYVAAALPWISDLAITVRSTSFVPSPMAISGASR